jgi:hypothetical protein
VTPKLPNDFKRNLFKGFLYRISTRFYKKKGIPSLPRADETDELCRPRMKQLLWPRTEFSHSSPLSFYLCDFCGGILPNPGAGQFGTDLKSFLDQDLPMICGNQRIGDRTEDKE